MNSTWFRRFTTAAGDGPRLVCFPHAGGSATAYMQLARTLPATFDVVSVQYPGRQDRYLEAPFTALAPLVEAVAEALAEELAEDSGRPYALFGHSMGALVAFETALLLTQGELPGPQRLFLSGRGGPGTRARARYDLFDDADVLADVRGLGGTNQAMLDDPEVLEMVLPALRADYQALGTYTWRGGEPLAAPITALVGDRDPMVTVREARTWQEHTTGGFDLKVFPGGHFYLVDHIGQVAAAVTDGLLAGTAAP
ncbi:thioesterase II family protein [Streptomyces sp. TLI_185]|uniref:thioesterase II family protein n=1 Tax=Streptomyces sp. TLI_185 TaxID=2485151 RepID=UPI000F4E4A4D|nr:alpha/beta fold hydrolase [Streptomyces sp. TLI_185]RPF24852.1 surfactin synthase thioesterase subunit [Streptomyces sp. TLI_185]